MSRSELTELGLSVLGPGASTEAQGIIKAVAAMIARGSGRTRKVPEGPKLLVSPRAVYQAVAETEAVLCTPIDGRWFARLGGVLKNLEGFDQAMLGVLCAWLRAGGVRGWPNGMPTFNHCITQLDRWLSYAVEWDRRGRNVLGGRTVVGSADEQVDWNLFKA